MGKIPRILCVDDEVNVLKALERTFLDDDYEIVTAASGEEGLAVLAGGRPVQIVVADYRMPEMNGVDFLREVCKRWPDTVRIVLSGYADIAAVILAINEGEIYRFIAKPWNDDDLRVTIANAVERHNLDRMNILLAEELRAKNEELHRINYMLERFIAEKASKAIYQNRTLTRCREILDALPVGVVSMDRDGLVVQCNMEGARLLDVPPGWAIGTGRQRLFPEELNLFIDELAREGVTLRRLIRGGAVRVLGQSVNGPGQEGVVLVLEGET
ncbi:MAG: response regulator [Geobacteraceae bacterium]|nr:response regulator [Geobacteraceae bacterium]